MGLKELVSGYQQAISDLRDAANGTGIELEQPTGEKKKRRSTTPYLDRLVRDIHNDPDVRVRQALIVSKPPTINSAIPSIVFPII